MLNGKPLCIDCYCGLGGWTEEFLAEGYRCVGFDIERHVYPSQSIKGGVQRYPGQLVLQDLLTVHGKQFRDADCLVMSPPCQNYSYMAMPWKRAKAMAADIRADKTGKKLAKLNELFDACFRIQREAIEATRTICPSCLDLNGLYYPNCKRCHGVGSVTRYIPMVVENVKGAQPWVGRAKWHYGSFYLWGDVPALMPMNGKFKNGDTAGGTWFGQSHGKKYDWRVQNPRDAAHIRDGIKGAEPVGTEVPPGTGKTSWFFGARADPRDMRKSENGEYTRMGKTSRDLPLMQDGHRWCDFCKYEFPEGLGKYGCPNCNGEGGIKQAGLPGPAWFDHGAAKLSSRSAARKAASAQIAKIPISLARHIARVYYPEVSK